MSSRDISGLFKGLAEDIYHPTSLGNEMLYKVLSDVISVFVPSPRGLVPLHL